MHLSLGLIAFRFLLHTPFYIKKQIFLQKAIDFSLLWCYIIQALVRAEG